MNSVSSKSSKQKVTHSEKNYTLEIIGEQKLLYILNIYLKRHECMTNTRVISKLLGRKNIA